MSQEIFVSFTRADREVARRLVDALNAGGDTAHRVGDAWWDEHIKAGQAWQGVLQDKLAKCDVFVILIGDLGVSGWVGAEVGVALSRHFSRRDDASDGATPLTILPVLVGDTPETQLPPFLSLFQYRRLGDPTDAADIAKLVGELRDAVDSGYRQPTLPAALKEDPFPGLAPYERKHEALFFGRHKEVYEALSLLGQRRDDGGRRRWLHIEGASGMGKSSLLRAGLLPAIDSGWARLDTRDVRLRVIGPMLPGTSPMAALAETLARAFGLRAEDVRARLRQRDFRLSDLLLEHLQSDGNEMPLLVIDQLEELFTLSYVDHGEGDADHPTDERQQFDRLIAQAISNNDSPLYLITTLRSDFVGKFELTPMLNACRRDAAHYPLLQMGEAGLRDVIKRSVQVLGFKYSDDTLPADILDEARGQPGALPLISNLLRRLHQPPSPVLERKRYKNELGGLGGALANGADELLESLGPQGKRRALDLLLALVEPGENAVHSRRSIEHRQALDAAGGDALAERVLDQLSGLRGGREARNEHVPMRLVLISGDDSVAAQPACEARVDLIHETLIREAPDGTAYWPALHQRIRRDDFLDTRARLEQQARAWNRAQSAGRNDVSLASGKDLQKFLKHRRGAAATTRAFLDASVRKRRNLRILALGLASVILLGAPIYVEGQLWLERMQANEGTQYADRSTLWVRWRSRIGLGYKPEFVTLPPANESACYFRGSEADDPNEQPVREVCVEPFRISRHEITFNEYDAYVLALRRASDADANRTVLKSGRGWGRGRRPVMNVSWFEARAYATWLGEQTGQLCALPSEAQWEYAARGGTKTDWFWGENSAAEYAWFDENSQLQTKPVGTRNANPFGLHDTAGNVWEWVEDCWHDNYENAPDDGVAWLVADGGDCDRRVVRGGSWVNSSGNLRSSDRFRYHPVIRFGYVGFRVVCRPDTSPPGALRSTGQAPAGWLGFEDRASSTDGSLRQAH